MRSFEEIKSELNHSRDNFDVEAFLRCAVELDDIGTPQAKALACRARGASLSLRSDNPAAIEQYQRAVAIYEELGDRSGVADTLTTIGNIYYSVGDYPAALDYHHQALALVQELGDRSRLAAASGNIGNVYNGTSDYPTALEHYHRALAIHEELGERSGAALAIGNIGNVYYCTGDNQASLEHYHRALAIHEELGERHSIALVTGNIGGVYLSTGDYAAALEHFHRALAIREELGDLNGAIRVKSGIVGAYLGMGSNDEAYALLKAMDAMQIDNLEVRIERELDRAVLLERSGDVAGAIATFKRALADAHEYGMRWLAAKTHRLLRDVALTQNDLAGYVEHNNEFTRIAEEISGKETTLKLAMQAKQREIDAVEREHQKHMAVLHSTLPKHIADRVARGEVVNDHHEHATVLFLDIVGFTSISDRIPSGHVVHLLEQIFTTLDAVCEKHNVVKIKTIGDSCMAVSFANTEDQSPNTRHVVSAGLCAVEMLAALNALEITMPPALGDTSWTKDIGDIKVRIGMHCGPVTAGVIGTQRMQYDVWGDTVNVASRMESTSEPGRIHVSEALAKALNEAHIVPRGTVDVKGKGTMQTYWLE